jgi:hypothetical protein
MRLGAAKTARESAKSPDEKDLRSRLSFPGDPRFQKLVSQSAPKVADK